MLACRCYTFADPPSETTLVHLSAQQPVKLLAIGGASTPSTQKERVVAFLQPLRGARLKRFIRRAIRSGWPRLRPRMKQGPRKRKPRMAPVFWLVLSLQAGLMHVGNFPTLETAKLQRRRLGARPMWSRSHA